MKPKAGVWRAVCITGVTKADVYFIRLQMNGRRVALWPEHLWGCLIIRWILTSPLESYCFFISSGNKITIPVISINSATRSRDGSVGIMILVHSVQTCSVIHPASRPMDSWVISRLKSGRIMKLTTHFHLVPTSKMAKLYIHSSYVSMEWYLIN